MIARARRQRALLLLAGIGSVMPATAARSQDAPTWSSSNAISARGIANATPAARARGTPPKSIPLGKYVCASVTSGFGTGNSTLAVMGQLRITGSSSYTALTREGTGAPARYTYDAATGAVEWAGGKLQGFFGTVTQSRFGVDSRGIPVITVTYRVRAGGNLFDLGCQREGA